MTEQSYIGYNINDNENMKDMWSDLSYIYFNQIANWIKPLEIQCQQYWS